MAIGSVRPVQNGQVAATSLQAPQTGAGDFASALVGFGQRLNVNAKTVLEHLDNERKQAEGFDARTRWTQVQGEFARSQIDTVQNAPANGTGLTQARYTELSSRREEFLATLSPELRPEYEALTQGALEDYTTNTYAKEVELRSTYESDALTRVAGDLAGEVLNGTTLQEAALAEFDEVLSKSQLPEASRIAMREAALADLGAAEFRRLTQEAMRTQTAVRPTDGSDVARGGMLPGERAMLNTIAAKESGGRYDIRFDGAGGATITDFSDHPRVFVSLPDGDKSSAAGRYMITASTWDGLVQRYGRETLPDFSEASQDKAAILLAAERYNASVPPSAPRFAEVINKGSDEELLNVKRILAGKGKATTWQAFQSMPDAEFLALFRGDKGLAGGGTGTTEVPDVWNDPKFGMLTYDQKLKLASEAQAAESSIQTALQEQKKEFADSLRMSVELGQSNYEDVFAAIEQGKVGDADREQLIKAVQSDYEEAQSATAFAERVATGQIVENTPETQKAAGRLLRDTGVLEGLKNNQPAAAQTLSTMFASGGVMPEAASSILRAQVNSTNPNVVAYAMDTLSDMRAKNYDMFAAALSKELVELEGVWTLNKKYAPEGDTSVLMERLRDFRDPAKAALRKPLVKDAEEQLKEIPDSEIEQLFDPSVFVTGPSLPVAPSARGILRSDFNELYKQYYPLFGDPEQTKEFVGQQMSYRWGADPISGNQLMYLGPTSSISGYTPTPDGSYDWMRDDLFTSMGWESDQQFSLVSDAQTEADVKQGKRATYTLLYADQETGEYKRHPMRIEFSIGEKTQRKHELQMLRSNVLQKMTRPLQEAWMPPFAGSVKIARDPVTVDYQSQLDEIDAELAALNEGASQ